MEQYQLGEWDLSELAKNPKSPAFQKQIKDLEDQAKKFEKIMVNQINLIFFCANLIVFVKI